MTEKNHLDITDYINSLEEGTEITLVFDNSSEYTHISLVREHPKTHAKTIFASYTPANDFSGNLELFRFKISKNGSNNDSKIKIKKKDKIKTKMGIAVELSLNPSLKWRYEREKESE